MKLIFNFKGFLGSVVSGSNGGFKSAFGFYYVFILTKLEGQMVVYSVHVP